MIIIKTPKEIELMKEAGHISSMALDLAGQAVEPGVTTAEIDRIVYKFLVSQGATPSFLNYGGFPASSCISVNEVVVHGIPSKSHKLKEGDIVSIDIGALFNGFHGDNAWTYACGAISKENQALMEATEQSLYEGIKAAVVGNRLGDIGHAVQEYTEARGYSVVRDFVGHGVGASLHEEPSVPNYGTKGRGTRLVNGMVIAIEPMINIGTYDVEVLDDEWTTITADNKPSAHFEHTVAITDDGPIVLTHSDKRGKL